MKEILNNIISYTCTILNNDSIVKDTQLFDTGMLDSLGIITLITEIENEYNIDLTDEDFDINNFSSPEKIAEMISRKIS